MKDERSVYIFTVEFIRSYIYYILEDMGYVCHNYVSKTCKNFTKIGNISCILVWKPENNWDNIRDFIWSWLWKWNFHETSRCEVKYWRNLLIKPGFDQQVSSVFNFTPGSFMEVSLSQSRPDEISDIISIILRFSHKNTWYITYFSKVFASFGNIIMTNISHIF